MVGFGQGARLLDRIFCMPLASAGLKTQNLQPKRRKELECDFIAAFEERYGGEPGISSSRAYFVPVGNRKWAKAQTRAEEIYGFQRSDA